MFCDFHADRYVKGAIIVEDTISLSSSHLLLGPVLVAPDSSDLSDFFMGLAPGERKPWGGEWSVVKETTSPAPITEMRTISTGWRGHQRAGGAFRPPPR
jgi:hypothetical protein